MYATCLFCSAPFERNEALESFPVGRRIAFDAAKGRLWVVCRKCERWCLSPLDERWEAVDQAERLYRDSRRRVSTDNIGLAKVADGTTLIRIGKPLRPEFAAWRYGDQFGRRRGRQIAIAAGGAVAISALVAGGALAGVAVTSFLWMMDGVTKVVIHGPKSSTIATVRDAQGHLLRVQRKHLGMTTLSRSSSGAMVLELAHRNEAAEAFLGTTDSVKRFEGDEARRVASQIIPAVNRFGGNKVEVARAVKEIEDAGTAERFLDDVTRSSHVYTRPSRTNSRWADAPDVLERGLFALPTTVRLGLEMALHEEAERRALEGELAELERAWRDAEEIAAISDGLLVPDSVNAALDQMKDRK